MSEAQREDLTLEAALLLEKKHQEEFMKGRFDREEELKATRDELEAIKQNIRDIDASPEFGNLKRLLEFKNLSKEGQDAFIKDMPPSKQAMYTNPKRIQDITVQAENKAKEQYSLEQRQEQIQKRVVELERMIESSSESDHQGLVEVRKHIEQFRRLPTILAELQRVTFHNYITEIPRIIASIKEYQSKGGLIVEELQTAVYQMGERLNSAPAHMGRPDPHVLEALFSLAGIQVLVSIDEFTVYITALRDEYVRRLGLSEDEFNDCLQRANVPRTERDIHEFQNERRDISNNDTLEQFIARIEVAQENLRQAHERARAARFWTCPSCTLENELQHSTCQACSTPRPPVRGAEAARGSRRKHRYRIKKTRRKISRKQKRKVSK